MIGPSQLMYEDEVTIHAPADELDADGSPDGADAESSVRVLCDVQAMVNRLGESARLEQHGGVEGMADYEIIFPSNPAVDGPDWVIKWVSREGEDFAEPFLFASKRHAVKVSSGRWGVSVREYTGGTED